MDLKEKTILQHKHNIDNAKRMYNADELSYECYMENKAIHEKVIEELNKEKEKEK